MFTSRLQGSHIGFSALGFFVIDRNAVLSVRSLEQLNPKISQSNPVANLFSPGFIPDYGSSADLWHHSVPVSKGNNRFSVYFRNNYNWRTNADIMNHKWESRTCIVCIMNDSKQIYCAVYLIKLALT